MDAPREAALPGEFRRTWRPAGDRLDASWCPPREGSEGLRPLVEEEPPLAGSKIELFSSLLLMVRSCLGRVASIDTAPHRAVYRAGEDGQNALGHAGAGGEMIPPAAPLADHRQRQPLTGRPQALGGGTGRRPL